MAVDDWDLKIIGLLSRKIRRLISRFSDSPLRFFNSQIYFSSKFTETCLNS